ncbi:FtsW/RodA/SpoVE family cell cycle protein [Tannockella kyphosi]|uniref:FtsW/RodA/SpoVE family cell cycle protein n=1 Tax=Tannockella kyphosi TaxID=2899121 RepID=UPI0020139E93|nr:FtsW/RodA/SpoVE family cell cycle protein [Tannockella kyphosi]
MSFLSKLFKNSKGGDRLIFLSVVVLSLFGIVMIGSASVGKAYEYGATWPVTNMIKQGIFVGIGFALMSLITRLFDPKKFSVRFFDIIFTIGLLAMLACRLFEPTSGAYAWIDLGFMTIQPSEIMKIIMILCLSYYFSEVVDSFSVNGKFSSELAREAFYKNKFKYCLQRPFLYIILVLIVGVFVQNDTGSMVIMLGICGAIFLLAQNKYYRNFKMVSIIIVGVGTVLLAVFFLQGYQVSRITTWLQPLSDVQDTSFQIANSLVAFANGDLFGSGFGNSTQKFGWIPVAQSDFIGPIIYEELGVFGLAFIMIPTCIIIYRLLMHSRKTNNTFYSLILVGISTYFFMHLFINLGGVSALIPMTGVPLLLVSSGGTSAIATFIAIGIAQAIIRKSKL